MPLAGVGGFVDSLAQRGVRVDRRGDFLVGGLHGDGEAKLGDHLSGIGSDDVGAEDFAVLLADEELHEPFALADGKGFAAGHEREFADLEFEAFFLRGAFGEADAGDLRLAIGASRENGDLLGLGTGEHSFDALDSFVAGDMCEPWWPNDVAGAVDAFDAGLVAVVGFEVTLGIGLELHAFGHEGRNADGHESDVGFEDFIGLAADGEANAFIGRLGFVHLGFGEDFDALLGEGFFERLADLGVLDGEDVRHHFDDGDFRAKGVEEIGEFHADGSRADDNDFLRLLLQNHGLAAADDAFSVVGEAGHLTADDARGDEDLRGFVLGLFAVVAGDYDSARLRDFGLAAMVIHLIFLKKHFDATREAVGDLAAATDDFVPLVGEPLDLQAEVAGVVLDRLVDLGVFEERLGGDAAPVQASAAGAVHFDHCHFFAELPCANCRDIA
ncbi:MAG: hypothetical protein RL630_1731, partial [Verrucomicrobiota bacterium]